MRICVTPSTLLPAHSRRISAPCGFCIVLFCIVNSGFATQIKKANNNNDLTNTLSWQGGTVPGSGDTAVWDNTIGATAPKPGTPSGVTFKGILYKNPTGATTIGAGSGKTLTLLDAGIDMSDATLVDFTLSTDLVLGANQTWTVASGRTINLSCNTMTGAYNLAKAGAGTIASTANVAYSGATILSAGTLSVNALANGTVNSPIGNPGSTAAMYLVFDGGTLKYTGTGATSTNRLFTLNATGGTVDGSGTGALTMSAGGGTIVLDAVASARTLTLTGSTTGNTFDAILGDYSSGNPTYLTKSGTGTWILSRANTYTGTTTVSQGTLQCSAANVISSSSPVSITTGAIFNPNANNQSVGSLTGGGNVTIGAATLTLGGDNSSPAAYTGVISGSNLIKSGTGTQTLNGLNTYTGTTAIQNGAISINTIKSVSGGSSSLGAPTTVANGTISLGNSTTAGSLIYTGGTRTTNRVINLAGSTGGGTIDNSGTGNLTFTSAITAAAGVKTLVLQGSAGTVDTFSGNIVNSGGTVGVTKAGTATWIVSGTNTYTGATTVNGGILRAGSASAFGSNSPVVMANVSGDTLDLANNNISIGSLTGGGSDGGNVKLGSGTLTVGGDNSFPAAFMGQISGAGGLIKTGTGTLTLNSANANYSTYGGVTTINGGTLAVDTLANGGANSDIGKSAATADKLIINAGGTLKYTGSGTSSDRLFTIGTGATGGTLDASGTGPLNLTGAGSMGTGGAGTLTLTGTNTGANTLAALISNNSAANLTSVTKTGSGTWVLTGANTDSGVTTISGGILEVKTLANGGTACGIGRASNANTKLVFDGGTLKYSGNAANPSTDRAFTITTNGGAIDASGTGSPGNLTISGPNPLKYSGFGARTFTLTGTDTANNKFAYALKDSGGATSLIKSGTGTWVDSAANTFTGTTTVAQGTLILAKGSSLKGPLTVQNGGTYSPGGSGAVAQIQILSYQLDAGGTHIVDITGRPPSRGTNYDQDSVTGSVTLYGDLVVNLTCTPQIGEKDTIINNDGTDDVVGAFAGIGEGLFVTASYLDTTYEFTVSYKGGTDNNDVVLTCANPLKAWSKTASTVNWSTAGNWTGGGAPGPSEEASFNGSPYSNLPSLDGAASVRGIAVGSGSDSVAIGDLGANTLTLGTSGINLSSATKGLSVNTRVSLGASQTWNTPTGHSLTVGAVADNGYTITIAGAGLAYIAGVMGNGSGGITKNGTGTLTLSGNNTFTGAIAVNAGILKLQSNNATGTPPAGGVTVASGAELQMQGGISIGNEALGLSGTGVSSGGALHNVSGANTWGGAITLNAATTIKSDADTLILPGNIANGSNELTIDGSGDVRINGAISGSGWITKNGSGKLILNGHNTLSGTDTISVGTLAGSFYVAGALRIAGGATLSPGNAGVGQDTCAGNFSLPAGATYAVDLNGTSVGQFDQLLCSGTTITLGGTLSLSVGFTPTWGDAFTIIDNQGGNSISGTFSGLSEGSALTAGSYTFQITYVGGSNNKCVVLTCIAPTRSWVGGTGSNWNDNNQWSPANFPTSTERANFNNASYNNPPIINVASNAAGIVVGSSSGAVTIGIGNTLTLGLSGINMASAASNLSINAGLTLGAAQTWTVASGKMLTASGSINNNGNLLTIDSTGNTTISGNISGAGGLTKRGSGTLTLSGTNSYGGTTTISAGTLNLTGSLSKALTIQNGATCNIDGIGAAATINTGSLDIQSGGTFGIEIRTGSYDQDNMNDAAGTVTLGGALNLSLACSPAKGDSFIIISNGGPSAVSGTFSNAASGITANNGGTIYAFLVNYAGGDGNDVVLTCQGTAWVWTGLDNQNGWSNGDNWAGGSKPISGSVIVYNSFTAARWTSGVNDAATGAIPISIVVIDPAQAVGIATGTAFHLNAGGIDMGSATQNFTMAQNTVIFDANQTFSIKSGRTLTWSGTPITGGSNNLSVTGAGTMLLQGVLNGTGSVNMNGTGVLTISSDNGAGFSGGFALNSGTLNINNQNALGNTTALDTIIIGGASTIDVNAGYTLPSYPQDWNAGFIFAGSNTLNMGAGNVFLGASPVVTVNASNLTIGGAISERGGARSLTKAGAAGTLTLNGNNTFTGAVTVSAGRLVLAGTNAYAGATTINTGATGGKLLFGRDNVLPNGAGKSNVTITGAKDTLDIAGYSDTINGLSGSGYVDKSAAGIDTLIVGGNNARSTFSGVIQNASGSLAIIKVGSDTLTLSGASNNTYSGSTTVSGGVLKLGKDVALGATTGRTTVNLYYSLDLGGRTVGAESLFIAGGGVGSNGSLINSSTTAASLSGPISLTGNDTIGGIGDITLSGAITGAFSLTKIRPDTLTLSNAACSYSGGTVIGAGKLNVTGALTGTGAVAVNAGKLAGTGSIAGKITVADNAVLQPGNNGAGTLTLSGGLKLKPNSVLDWQVGTNTDSVKVTGDTLTLDGTINITALAGFDTCHKTIMTYANIADSGLTVGNKPSGYNFSYTITIGGGKVQLVIGRSKWSITGLGQINGGALAGSAIYLGTGTGAGAGDSIRSHSLATGARNWSSSTGGKGACKTPTWGYYSGSGTYKVLAAATNCIIGKQENGTDLSWSPLTINGAGTPYISPAGDSFYVPASAGIVRCGMGDPVTHQSSKAVPSLNASADIVVSSDFLYCGTTDGKVYRLDLGDFTTLTFYGPMGGSPRVDLPLIKRGGTLYATPNNDTLHAINTAAPMGLKWKWGYTQHTANTGPAFMTNDKDTIYTAAGNYVYKIADKATAAEEKWYYNTLSTINSGPVRYNGTVYFGASNGNYYAVKDADGMIRANWPRSIATGNASAGPWIDPTTAEVIFGTTGGNLDAFDLEP